MKKSYLVVVTGLIGISFLGCSTKKVSIRTKMPPKVKSLENKRDIAVLPFKNDKINFSGRLESKLANVKVEGKPYFNVVNRDRIGEVLKELKFQSSDLVGKKAVRFGRLAGVKVIITGNVETTKSKGKYLMPQEVCDEIDEKKKCISSHTAYITCRTSSATLNTSIKAIDVNTAKIVDAVNISKSYKFDTCKDKKEVKVSGLLSNTKLSAIGGLLDLAATKGAEYAGVINQKKYKTPDEALNDLADEAADEYVKRIAPHYVTLNVELIDKVKSVDLNDTQEKMFENALTYIEQDRLDRAEEILKKLNRELNENSYEVAYDLGVVEEAQGKLKEAKAAYNLSDRIIENRNLKPDELVSEAIKRISLRIKEKNEELN